MKILKKILVYLVLIIIGLIIGSYIYLQTQKPDYDGELNLQGLHDKVEVYFDEWGIPHIYALNQHDAYMALGYVHAQERLFQMEMMRRVASGRLAEILGKDLVETDKFFRALGLKKAAQESAKADFESTNDITISAKAYLDGVNQYIKTGSLPVEFLLIGIPKEEFKLEDMYMIAGYMAYTFEAAFKIDPLMTKIQNKLGDKYLKDFALDYVAGTEKIPVHYKIDSSLAFTHKINEILDNLPVPLLVGSNSWVISPEKSKSGKVIFSNDTHIGYAQPSVWYEAHMEYPGFSMYGNHLAGIPFALLGHNRHSAWGLTMFENDDLDMFREKLNPENPNQVWFKDHWEDLKIMDDKIKVKNGEDVDFQLKISRHGPIMNDLLGTMDKNESPVAVWWTYPQFKSRLLEAFYLINHSTKMDDVANAASLIHAPGLNVMYGDAEGNIAWWAAAKLVKRPEHVQGKLILDGSSGKDEFLGFYDFKDNPQSVNPPEGFVYSANNQPDTIAGILYPGYYAPEDRANRIVDFLKAERKWDIDGMKGMITNAVSTLHPQEAKYILGKIDKNKLEGNSAKAYQLLNEWDGEHQTEEIAPTIFYKLLYKVLENIFLDELGDEDFNSIVSTHMMERTYPSLFENDSSIWWDNVNTDEIEKRADIFNLAFEQIIEELEKQLGENIDEWKWSKVHILEHVHPIGRSGGVLADVFNVGPFHVMGGQQVINNIDFNLNGSGLYKATYGPAIRILLDFADLENSISVLPTGQSGRFMSKHYDDQAEMYNTGKFRKQMMDRNEIIEKSSLLKLNPAK
ncbi:MAG: penicillin acylase family protein [Bacteroidota bacterium]